MDLENFINIIARHPGSEKFSMARMNLARQHFVSL